MLAEFLTADHRHCDEAFVDAEHAVVRRDWEAATAALRSFVEATERHLRREEDVLFPAFEAATGMVGGPTQMMRFEHAQMRELLEQMQAALERRERDPFAGSAETLLVLMQQHNMKEENILYPMCDQHLSAETGELLARLEMELAES